MFARKARYLRHRVACDRPVVCDGAKVRELPCARGTSGLAGARDSADTADTLIGPATTLGARAAAARDVTFLGQPLICLRDHTTRHAQLCGQHPAGRQRDADRQAAVGNGATQLPGQPVRQTAGRRRCTVELKEVRSRYGLSLLTFFGPFHQSIILAESRPMTESMAPGPAQPGLRSVAPGVLGMVLVGSSVAISATLTTAPLLTAQAIRYSVAAIVLVALARILRIPVTAPRGREWLWLTGIAASGLVLFNIAVVRGVAHAQPAMIAVAVACAPVVLGVLGPLLQGHRPQRRIVLAAAVVTAGAALVEGAGHGNAAGIAWAVLALACEAAFTLLAVPVLGRHGPWGVSVHTVWLGAAMFAVLAAHDGGTGRAHADCRPPISAQ